MEILSRLNNFLMDYGSILEMYDHATHSSELVGWEVGTGKLLLRALGFGI